MNLISPILCILALIQQPPEEDVEPEPAAAEPLSPPPAAEPPSPPPAAEPPSPPPAAEPLSPPPAAEKAEKAKKVEFDWGARIIAGARLVHTEPAVDPEGAPIGEPERKGSIDLRQARLRVEARYLDVLSVRISIDVADLLGKVKPGEVVRDAWANVMVRPAFQIKVGQFKRPYSRLELRGTSSIPVIGRGLYNGFAIEDRGWGTRAVGVALWGEIEPMRPGLYALGWAVSASNDALSGAPHGVDVHARLTYDPIEWLSIGASGAFKHVQDPLADEAACRITWTRGAACRREVFGAGMDVALRVAGLYASVEANLAQDWSYSEGSPWIVGALAYASYDFEIGERARLQPVVFGELIDTNLSYAQSEAVRAVAGFNVLWTKRLRVMPQAEFVVPIGPRSAFNQFVERQVYGLWVSVQI